MEGCGNGLFGKKRYFNCPDGKAYFCRISVLQSLDSFNPPTPPASDGAPLPILFLCILVEVVLPTLTVSMCMCVGREEVYYICSSLQL